MGTVIPPTGKAFGKTSEYQPHSLRPWYAHDSSWRLPFEAAAMRAHSGKLSAKTHERKLIYEHDGLEVVGSDSCVAITIVFDADQQTKHFGLNPVDYPSIYVAPEAGARSTFPHRMPDGGLCLFYPEDPPEQRWQSENGLEVLLGLIANHLFAEDYWLATGGVDGGEWVIAEAPHGFPSQRKGRGRR